MRPRELFGSRLSSLKNEKFVQLAVVDYEFRQSIYKNEMAELKRYH